MINFSLKLLLFFKHHAKAFFLSYIFCIVQEGKYYHVLTACVCTFSYAYSCQVKTKSEMPDTTTKIFISPSYLSTKITLWQW